MAIVFVQVHWNEVRVVDCYQNNWEGFEHYKWILHDKNYKYATHYFPHDIKVRELTSGQSRLETVRHMFWDDNVEVLPQLKIMDWIQAARKNFAKFWFDQDKCELLIEALSLYRQKFDTVRWMFLNTPEHDWTSHYADAFRYMAVWFDKLTNTGHNDVSYHVALNDYLDD